MLFRSVGRPRSRLVGGGSAGRLDCIQASTSCSHQHRRRLPGSLNGGGIRCRYFSLVAQVLIAVSALPINAEVSSMWRRRGVPLLEAADFLLIFFTILKALDDWVAFAAHDCAARKFSDGCFEGRGGPKKRDREEPANQRDSSDMHAFIEGFVPSADQVVMRGNPQSDYRNEDTEQTGDHADCKHVRQQCPCDAWN